MEAQLIERQAVQATFRVTVPAAEVDDAFEAILRSLARQVRVPGFRPGKAPRGMLTRRIGREALQDEVRDALVEANYPKAVRELGLEPVHAHFDGEAPTEGEAYTFRVEVDLYPDFELPDLDEIVIDTEWSEVGQDQLDETVENLRQQHATLVPVDRTVEAGDVVLVESLPAEPEADDADPAEPEAAEPGSDEGNTMPIDLERVDAELGDQLLGKAMDDVVVLELRPPPGADDDAERPTLRVRIRNIQRKDKPEADDEFAATLGFDSWDATLDAIRASLQNQHDQETFETIREEFVDKLVAETDFDLPASLVERRKAHLLQDLEADLQRRRLTLERYLASLDDEGEREAFDRELDEAARNGVRRDLVLEKLMEERATELTEEEFRDAVRAAAARDGKDLPGFRRERGEAWLRNYRFLLTRDKALRETLRDKVGEPERSVPTAASASGTGGDAERDEEEEIVEAGSAPAPGSDGA